MASNSAQDSQSTRGGDPLRWVLGGAVLSLSALCLIWTCILLNVEWRFRSFNVEGRFAQSSLARYSLELENLLKLDPTNGRIRNEYASVWAQKGSHALALEEASRARLTNNVQNSLYFIADMLEKMDKKEEAEAVMADCVLINPTNVRFNRARLRLLGMRVNLAKKNRDPQLPLLKTQYAQAARNWVIRAPHDRNSWMFIANFYINPPYYLQAYRCYLLGLSTPDWMGLGTELMIAPEAALQTIGEIFTLTPVRPYRNLPGGLKQSKGNGRRRQ